MDCALTGALLCRALLEEIARSVLHLSCYSACWLRVKLRSCTQRVYLLGASLLLAVAGRGPTCMGQAPLTWGLCRVRGSVLALVLCALVFAWLAVGGMPSQTTQGTLVAAASPPQRAASDSLITSLSAVAGSMLGRVGVSQLRGAAPQAAAARKGAIAVTIRSLHNGRYWQVLDGDERSRRRATESRQESSGHHHAPPLSEAPPSSPGGGWLPALHRPRREARRQSSARPAKVGMRPLTVGTRPHRGSG